MTTSDLHQRVRRIADENRRLFQQIADGEARLQRLAKSVWRGQEQERQRLARELHDGVGQTLTALKNQLAHLAQSVLGEADASSRDGSGQQRPEEEDSIETMRQQRAELGRRLAESIELTAGALEETRQLSRMLRPPVLDDLGLEAALRWLARSLHRHGGLEVELQLESLEGALDPDLETVVFRIVQEGLTNILKYAGSPEAVVRLELQRSELRLEIRDRGRGFDVAAAERGEGSGLRGIRDRVEIFGGALRIGSTPGVGTELVARLPLSHPNEPEPADSEDVVPEVANSGDVDPEDGRRASR